VKFSLFLVLIKFYSFETAVHQFLCSIVSEFCKTHFVLQSENCYHIKVWYSFYDFVMFCWDEVFSSVPLLYWWNLKIFKFLEFCLSM